ncbi:MAG TPA: hypothetical protein VJV78_34035 [Polyangiales bacterium]|nr:hypothetical protein [Polyangiales bacterium]
MSESIVRHFRQIVMWPLQLIPLKPWSQVQHHWEAFAEAGSELPWAEVLDEFTGDPSEFHERHYREFVTFLPHVQRFLYGQGRSSSSSRGYGESPMRVFRRSDITQMRLTFDDRATLLATVKHVDLYFYYDVDVVMLAFEFFADDVPLHRVQDILYRFGRSYPAQWDESGVPDQCMRNVEWLDESGRVLSSSDFSSRQTFLSHACEHREARIGRHWQYLLRPMVQHHSEIEGEVRYRQLEYHRLPKMTYLSFDNPFALRREDFFRLGMATAPDDGGGFPYPEQSLAAFEREHCYDHFWVPGRSDMRASTRILCNARSLVMIGCARDRFYSDCETGMLGQFRHQYFLLGMIAQFHRAALLMLSDRMVLAVSRLDVDDPESLERFRHHMRHSTEIFLRFNHRYWFHEVSKQSLAKDLFRIWSQQLGNDALFQEVREEVLDMGQYLDSDAARRQSDVVLRLTVVTILGLIGTIATGFLGMNLIDETSEPLYVKIGIFLAVMVPSVALTLYTVLKSGPLSEFIDAMANERLSTRSKFERLVRVFRGPAESRAPAPKRLAVAARERSRA